VDSPHSKKNARKNETQDDGARWNTLLHPCLL
jgi:hypothetical protein